jgi:uncharacterized membrane protein YgcG
VNVVRTIEYSGTIIQMKNVPPAAPDNSPVGKAAVLDPGKVRLIAALILAVFLAAIFLVPRRPAPPPSPAHPDTVFLDRIGLVSPEFAADTTRWLHARSLFEAVVYIDGEPPEGDLRSWTVRTATDWGVGTERQDRGLVLFVFRDARVARAEIGYGLEGALPDALVRRLLEATLASSFSQGRYEEGVQAFLNAIHEDMGGDAAVARLARDTAGRAHDAWEETWRAAWKNGHRLLPAVWQRYVEGSAMERIGILVFGAIPITFLAIAIGVLANTVQLLAVLPGKLRARKAHAAEQAAEAAAMPTKAPSKVRRGKPGVPLAQRLAAMSQASAAEFEWQRRHDPRWFEVVFGPAVFLLCAAVVVFAISMAPDWVTRQGMFGGGGVAVMWSAPPVPVPAPGRTN